jgi:spore germination cell wall hydrolase CwlJ-like protein
MTDAKTALRVTVLLTAGAALSACTTAHDAAKPEVKAATSKTAKINAGPPKQVYTYTAKDRDCLKRAMYFESQRTSEAGFLAVGSVIMNRLTSGMFPPTICGVVAQKKQFAPGVMTRSMDQTSAPALDTTADAVLKGERHPDVKEAMFFHQKGLRFRYTNMHYTAAAGGNVFYEKRDEDGELQTAEPMPVDQYVLAYAGTSVPPLGDASAMSAFRPVTSPLVTATSTSLAPDVSTAGAIVSGTPSTPIVPAVVAPAITPEIARASLGLAADSSAVVPSLSPASGDAPLPAGLTTKIPVPIHRPDTQKSSNDTRPAVGKRADIWPLRPA